MALTIEQAVGQKLMLAFEGTEPSAEILETIQTRDVGGITLFRHLNTESPSQVRSLTTALQETAAKAGQPPLLIATDQEGGQLMAIGDATLFPGNMALGATGSIELARKTGRALGRELATMGVNVNYAPVCDVNSNPQNPNIGIRSFGEDPAMVARFCAAMVEGLQSSGVAATAKHFPGHGDANGDPHYGTPIVLHDRERLAQIEIPPFAAAIEAKVRLIMTTHVAFPNLNEGVALPSTLSPMLLEGLLRDEMGFQRVIVSDAMNMAAIKQEAGLIVDVIAAVAAGVDLLLLLDDTAVQEDVYSALLQATQRRLLSPAKIISSAERVLVLKQWLADMPQPASDVVGCAEHRDLAFETAARSITLVRDEAHLLPLRLSSDARLAVVVPQPVALTPADTSSYVTCTLAQALRHYHPAVDEFVVPHVPSDADVAALRQQISDYDTVVVGTINASTQPDQAALMKAVLETGVPTIATALRLPYDLQVYPMAPTYICTYSILPPSMETLAQALWGQIPFLGRLPVSIPELYPLGHGLNTSSSQGA
jgi:beta-N-acetylhexosaminidase